MATAQTELSLQLPPLWQRSLDYGETRTGKTCLHCGEPLTGRKTNWCCDAHGREFANSFDRAYWRMRVVERDRNTCQRCGWHATPGLEDALQAIFRPMWDQEMQKHWKERRPYGRVRHIAMAQVGFRQLEAHHITPLEWGGPEFDIANGMTLCHLCHDQVHRELGSHPGRSRSPKPHK